MSYPLFHALLKKYGRVETEYRFHPVRRWRMDFAFPDHLICIEVEGLSYHGKKSRHTTNSGYKGDIEKYNACAVMGWLLLRFTPDMLNKQETFDTISKAFELRTNQKNI